MFLEKKCQINEHKIISLLSNGLIGAEMTYTTTEKKLLAIVHSITNFRVHLLVHPFIIVSDHQRLTFLNRTPYHIDSLSMWILFIHDYSFALKYCKGRNNILAAPIYIILLRIEFRTIEIDIRT